MSASRRHRDRHDYVRFERPPVIEVALTLQFDPSSIDLDAIGRFAEQSRTELPDRSYQPVAPPMSEQFDVPLAPPPPPFELRFEGNVEMPRIWYVSADGTEVVQVQHDRFTLNWRYLESPDNDYPRYSKLRQRLIELLDRLEGAAKEAGGGDLTVNLCEVTYVNPIVASARPRPDRPFSEPARIVRLLRGRRTNAFLPPVQDVQLQARWIIDGGESGLDVEPPAGRLHLNLTPGLRPPEMTPIYMMNLTARVNPSGSDRKAALEALDVAHKWVVLGFQDLTTEAMHRRWGLIKESE